MARPQCFHAGASRATPRFPALPFVNHVRAPSELTLLDTRSEREPSRHSSRCDFSIYARSGVSDMSVDNVRPEVNPLFAFTLTIVSAFAAGLPMAVAIIWICS